ncbi:hypothetical protein B0A55_03699 [Friedmanniomyces simplex]|uniref:Uncharacterized protein n=1 Tax=Friedmanniomyces simplex TaxID=329884 RepID=A0A4U0XST9_9PEZI|nr:hypothetical protein B0A55_03699 [Friedmanniomyces simplex]
MGAALKSRNDLPSTGGGGDPYWRKIKAWENVSEAEFMSYRWQVANTVERKSKLLDFLSAVLPAKIPASRIDERLHSVRSREDFLRDVEEGMRVAPMAVRLTPHILSVADWSDPLDDPIRKQFVPLASAIVQDHPQLSLDSLHETDDSPVPGLVHRYPEKVLFLGK